MVKVALDQHPLSTDFGDVIPLNQKSVLLPEFISLQDFIASKQASLFSQLKQNQFSGQLILRDAKNRESILYFYLGRLIYGTGGIHSVRRWQRNLTFYCPQVKIEPTVIDNHEISWEYQLLSQWLKEQKISREQFSTIIRAIIREILFDLTQSGTITYQLKAEKFSCSPSLMVDSDQVIVETWKQWQAWQAAKLADRSPNKAPIIKNPQNLQLRTSRETYQALTQRLTGNHTLRDLAVQLNQDLLLLTRSLMLYIQWGFVELVNINDLPFPYLPSNSNAENFIQPKQGVIVCIDNSPILGQLMRKVVTSVGYQFISATDELSAMAICLEKKPNLIFLDLSLKDSNSYELCRDLRKLPIFSQTPIIALANQVSMLEQIRAKVVGASELFPKPIHAEHLLQVIAKYLEQKEVSF